MTIEATSNPALVPKTAEGPIIHPRWVRVTPLVNALAMLMMIGSGWQIYDASPPVPVSSIFPTHLALGQWLARRLAMAFRCNVAPGHQTASSTSRSASPTGRFRRKLLPIRPREVVNDVLAAFAWKKLAHDDLSVYNAVQRALVCRGHPRRCRHRALRPFDPGSRCNSSTSTRVVRRPTTFARYVHFFRHWRRSWVFLTVHVALALIVPKSLRAHDHWPVV